MRGRREACVTCQQPVFLAERLVVGAPGQLMHRTCFRCARCSTQLTLAGYYQTERGQYCCETCPDEERRPTLAPAAPATHTDTDSDSSSEESESEEEEASEVSEAPRLPDTPAPTPSPTPPRPRTVFLSQTLEHKADHTSDNTTDHTTHHSPTHFSKVSPALFGDTDRPSRVREHSPDPSPLPRTPKSLRTDQPVVDTGQARPRTPPDTHTHANKPRTPSPNTHFRPHTTPAKATSSIVARRLQMFQEMSDADGHKDKEVEEGYKRRSVTGRGEEEVAGSNTTHIPSITITSVVRKRDDTDATSTTTTTTATVTTTTTTTAQNPFEEEDEDESAERQGEEEKSQDRDQVVSDRQEREGEKSDKDEKEAEKRRKEESNAEKSRAEESESGEIPGKSRHGEESDSGRQREGDKVVDAPKISDTDPVVNESEENSAEVDSTVVSAMVDEHPIVKEETHNASATEEQYPDDLNPFGSEEEEEEPKPPKANLNKEGKDTRIETEGATGVTTASPHNTTARKVIKPNLNPFESDEEEEEEEEEDRNASTKEGKKSLNPFWSDGEEEEEEELVRGRSNTASKGTKVKPPRPPPPTLPRNRSPSTWSTASTASLTTTPRRKKVVAPPPPSSPHLSLPPSPGGSVALRKKIRRAPAPPQLTPGSHPSPSDQDTHSLNAVSSAEREGADEVLSWKLQKDLKNHSNKINGTQQAPPKPPRSPHTAFTEPSDLAVSQHCPVSKSEAGEWKRKKGPAPPRPVPQKRALKKLPMKVIQQELQDIEIKQTELERQGVLLETSIRKRTEASAPPSPQEEVPPPASGGLPVSPNSIEVEDMILQLFELVNEKNELFRRQTELMYLKREKRLEEEHVELEYQIRCLMLKAPSERSAEDTAQEEELIGRLVKVVEQRDEIINCLELDRLREAQEDESIATHMMQYQEKHIDGLDNGNNNNNNNNPEPTAKKKKTLKLPKKKKKKKEKKGGGATGDADKDVDECETPTDPKKKKKKKKWLF